MIEVKPGTNIKDLIIAEPKVSLDIRFDPAHDLTDEDHEKMFSVLEAALPLKTQMKFSIAHYARMRSLFPEKPSDAGADLDMESYLPYTMKRLSNEHMSHYFDISSEYILWTLLSAAVIKPEILKEKYKIMGKFNLDTLLHKANFAFEDAMLAFSVDDNPSRYLEGLDNYFVLKMLAPHEIRNLRKDAAMMVEKEPMNDFLDWCRRGYEYDAFPQALGLYRLMQPKEFNSISITDSDWQKMQGMLIKQKESNNANLYGNYAFWLNIIGADDVKLDEKGLRIKRNPASQEFEIKNKLPQRRMF